MSTASSPSASARRASASRPPCTFCDIVAGRAPASIVLESPRAVALIPLQPKSDGHCLVVPKRHATRMHEVPDATLRDIAIALKRLAAAMDLDSYDILQVNGAHANDPGIRPRGPPVLHVHFHLIPRTKGDGVRIMSASSSKPTRQELDCMAERIRRRLRKGGSGAL